MPHRNTIESEKHSYRSRSLPHRFDTDKPIFITFRLKFTLPGNLLQTLSDKKVQWFKKLKNMNQREQEHQLQDQGRTFFCWYDELIATHADMPNLLRKKEISDIVIEALRFHDGVRYALMAFCVMPNHVHVLIHPLVQESGDIYPIAHVTYTWKRYTANRINTLLGRRGNLWQQESYDRMIRDEAELASTFEYIIQNPVKAGLVDNWLDWPGTWMVKYP